MARSTARLPAFEVGTLSFARCGTVMMLAAKERVRLILAASDAYAPDLLVTAGYAVHSRKHLHRLAAMIADAPRGGTIITEVHHDGTRPRDPARSHAMWAIDGDGDLYRFGRQAFATSREVREADGKGLGRFLARLDNRTLTVGGHEVFALICGEINIVHGRDHAAFLDADAAAAILAAAIVINPTHDRMSNAGTLQAKRRLLSQARPDSTPRAYVSCSNWEACGLNGRVQYPSPTLHTVYVAGQPLAYDEVADGTFGFVYRRWRLSLGGGP